MSNYNAWFSSKGDVYYLQPEVDVTHHVSYSSFVSAFCRNEMKDRHYRSVQKHRALLNHETAKHRNSYFFQLFFLEHRNSQRNKFSWYWFCWEICGICKVGLQTRMSRCAIDSLDKQSGWKLSLSLVEKYIQTKVSYFYYCILREKRRNLTHIKVQTFADAKLGTFRVQIRLRLRLRVRVFQRVPGAHARLREAVTSTRSVVKISSPSWHQLRDFQEKSSPDYEYG